MRMVMKSRPILYRTQMVRAIQEGHKTETRRTRGLDKINYFPVAWQFKGIDHTGEYVFYNPVFYDKHNGLSIGIKCPYGQVGDQLWVRETFYVQPELWARNHEPQPIHYAADGLTECLEDYIIKPSIFMPRWASRITTENTKIRVERVQDIYSYDKYGQQIDVGAWKEGFRCPNSIAAFMLYWDKLNAKRGYPWKLNPWIWVIEFKEIK